MATQTSKKTKSYHHGNLREALMRAAMERIARSNDFDFKLRDLSDDCGVSLAASYRHFASKRDLLVQIAIEGFQKLNRELSASPDTAEFPPEEIVRKKGVAYITFALQHPIHYLVMFHPALTDRSRDPALLETAIQALDQLRHPIERVVSRNRAADPTEVAQTVFRAWSSVHGYAALLVAREPAPNSPTLKLSSDPKAIDEYVSRVGKGLFP